MFRKLLPIAILAAPIAAIASEETSHILRVLPIGDPPPFVQEVRDGARYEVAPPEGAVPPRLLHVPAPTESSVSNASTSTLRLRLGSPSLPVTLPPVPNLWTDLRHPDGRKWLTVPLHPSGRSLAVVWRGATDWHQARTIVMADDDTARAENSVHFANLTGSSVAVVFGSERIRLDSGKTFSRTVEAAGAPVPLEVLYPTTAGTLRPCHSTSLQAGQGTFHRILIHAADRKQARMPVKVLHLEETAQETALTRNTMSSPHTP